MALCDIIYSLMFISDEKKTLFIYRWHQISSMKGCVSLLLFLVYGIKFIISLKGIICAASTYIRTHSPFSQQWSKNIFSSPPLHVIMSHHPELSHDWFSRLILLRELLCFFKTATNFFSPSRKCTADSAFNPIEASND